MKFVAKTIVSLTIKTKKGNNVRISFDARTAGGSYYKTYDEDIIWGLRNHHSYGKSYTELAEEPEPIAVEPVEVADPNAPSVIKVESAEDAKEYLVDKFEVSRTQLRSVVKIKEFASAHNIEFEGI